MASVVASTRSAKRKATFEYVMKSVLEINDNDLLLKALDGLGIESIPDILAMDDPSIEALSWKDSSGLDAKSVLENETCSRS